MFVFFLSYTSKVIHDFKMLIGEAAYEKMDTNLKIFMESVQILSGEKNEVSQ